MFGKKKKERTAPEFPANLEWINSEPLSMKSLRGRVVLIDIWTYSCVNCQRTLPHIKDWHKKYADKGLTIIGVHTPEFDFEKIKGNVEKAVDEAGIEYPVVLDPDYKVWNLYDNHWWPRKLLIDKDGKIIHDRIGEGGYEETEAMIRDAVLASGGKSLPEVFPEEPHGRVCLPVTPETYLGFERGVLANKAEVDKGHFHEYKLHKDKRLPSLEGRWKVTREYVESASGSLHMPFSAGEVNAVMELAEGAGKSTVVVSIDGAPVGRTGLGNDVEYDDDETISHVDGSRMYNLLMSDDHIDGKLRIDVPAGVRIYALTFGGAC